MTLQAHIDLMLPTTSLQARRGTLDIDCLDPAFAPGTGTPEPAGLTRGQVMTLLESWTDLPFVGMDCVEVAPAYDHAEITSLAAAHFIWTYLCGRIRTARVRA